MSARTRTRSRFTQTRGRGRGHVVAATWIMSADTGVGADTGAVAAAQTSGHDRHGDALAFHAGTGAYRRGSVVAATCILRVDAGE